MKENINKYVTSKRALEILGISIVTLRSWASKGIIDTIRTAGNHRLYNVDKYLNKIENHNKDEDDNNSIIKSEIKFNGDTNSDDSENETNVDYNLDSESDGERDDEEQEHHNNHSDSESDDNNIKFNDDSEDDDEENKKNDDEQDEEVDTKPKKIDYRNMGRLQPTCNRNDNKSKNKKNEKNNNYDSDNESNIKKTKYNKKKYNVCYIRVSNLSEVPLLNQQESYVKKIYPNYKIITDIGSGLDFNKEGFLRLFSMILNKKINKLVLLNKGSVLPPAYNFIKKLIVEFNDGQLIIDKNKKISTQNNFQSDLKHLMQYYD
jgi:predicted site-specific integrase-resolvase